MLLDQYAYYIQVLGDLDILWLDLYMMKQSIIHYIKVSLDLYMI